MIRCRLWHSLRWTSRATTQQRRSQRGQFVAGKGKRDGPYRVIECRESDDNMPDSREGICQQIQARKESEEAGRRNHRAQERECGTPTGSQVHHDGREDEVDEIELRIWHRAELEGGARADQFGRADGDQEKPVRRQRDAAERLVKADAGNAGEELRKAAKGENDDHCSDVIPVRNCAELRKAQGESADRHSE